MKIKKLIAILSTGVMLSTACFSASAETFAGLINNHKNGSVSNCLRHFDGTDGTVKAKNAWWSSNRSICKVEYFNDAYIEAGISDCVNGKQSWDNNEGNTDGFAESGSLPKGNLIYHYIAVR